MKQDIDDRLKEELFRRFGHGGSRLNALKMQWRYLSKKWLWSIFTGASFFVKRLVDIVITGILTILLLPVFAGIAIAIYITDPGPITYKQVRIGKWGREFDFYKFRSMVVGADKMKDELLGQDESGGVTFKMKKDPRVTTVGRFIRRFSLDELPQLFNVLIGDMSLVGPRPPVPREVAEYTLEDRRRLNALPGITCIWQVSGRSDIPFEEQVELDDQYIQSQGFWVDLKILFKTIPAVLSGKGAY